jgi:hypothetical protein
VQGSGVVRSRAGVDINGREGEEEREDLSASESGSHHQRRAALEDHAAGELVALVPQSGTICGRGISGDGSLEGVEVIVGGEFEERGEGLFRGDHAAGASIHCANGFYK